MLNREYYFSMCNHLDRLNDEELIKELELCKNAGVKTLRFGFIWAKIEKKQGEYDFDRYDFLVNSALKYGIEVLPIIARSPKWAISPERKQYNSVPPEFPETIGVFMHKTVEHFKGRIKYWEIWNEPNLASFWRPEPNASEYVEILKACFINAREADPKSRILMCGLALSRYDRIDFEYLEEIYKSGGADYFDIINIHPYSGPNAVELMWSETVLKFRALNNKYKVDEKPVWVTETGNPIHVDYLADEMAQAACVVKTYAMMAEETDISRIFWYDLRNDGIRAIEREDNFGLVRKDFTLKAAYQSYKFMNELLRNNKFAERIQAYNGTRVYSFSGSEYGVIVIWTEYEVLTLEVDFPTTQLEINSIFGDHITSMERKGKTALVLRNVPIYLKVETKYIDELTKALGNAPLLIMI